MRYEQTELLFFLQVFSTSEASTVAALPLVELHFTFMLNLHIQTIEVVTNRDQMDFWQIIDFSQRLCAVFRTKAQISASFLAIKAFEHLSAFSITHLSQQSAYYY